MFLILHMKNMCGIILYYFQIAFHLYLGVVLNIYNQVFIPNNNFIITGSLVTQTIIAGNSSSNNYSSGTANRNIIGSATCRSKTKSV